MNEYDYSPISLQPGLAASHLLHVQPVGKVLRQPTRPWDPSHRSGVVPDMGKPHSTASFSLFKLGARI